MSRPPGRILVYRPGSIGDFVIALPCLSLIRRCYPRKEIVLFTNKPAHARIVSAESILRGTSLVDSYIEYLGGTRNLRELWSMRNEIHALAPEALIYLAPPRGLLSAYRDYAFFRICGIGRIVGVPLTLGMAKNRTVDTNTGLHESDAVRLGRHLAELGEIDFGETQNWDLRLSAHEIAEAARIVAEGFDGGWYNGSRPVLGLSIGTKQAMNDWGDANWREVLKTLRKLDYALLVFGGPEDRRRSQDLVKDWPGTVLNLCGKVSPRVSAAVLKHVRLFLCHDSGPMHLAAAVGTRCVAVFSRKNPPGKWFPFGTGHQALYPTSGSGAITDISARQVVAAVIDALANA